MKLFPTLLQSFACIVLISVDNFECVSELLYRNFYKQEKLTNTFKLTHRNKQNTNKTSYFGVYLHNPHAPHLYTFYL
jgi:hypothetical protein